MAMERNSEVKHPTLTKLTAVPVLLSALFLGSSAKGKEASDPLQPSAAAPDVPLRIPISGIHEAEKATSKKLLPSMGGVELIEGSKAQALLKDLNTFWSAGRSAPSERVAELLRIATQEHGTLIAPERLRTILDQNQTQDVQLGFLKFSLSSPFMGVSDKTLGRFWSSMNPEILAHALLCKAEEIGRVTPLAFFSPYQKHPSPEVRQACAIAMMAGGHPLPSLSAFDLFQCSTQLSIGHHAAGLEGRIVMKLSQLLYPNGATGQRDLASPNHITALLHLLQRGDQAFPGYFEGVNRVSPDYFTGIARELSATIAKERAAVLNHHIATPEAQGIIALHFESQFAPLPGQLILNGLGAKEIALIKAGPLSDGTHGVDHPPFHPIKESTFREEYLKELDLLRSSKPKEIYLNELSARSPDTSRPLLIIHNMHGGPDHSWFYHGAPGKDDSNDLGTSRAISHRDLAETLFQSSDISRGAVNLGHVTIILDACRQYTVAQETLARLEALASRAGVEISSYPTIVALSQPFMYASMSGIHTVVLPSTPEEERTIPKEGLVFKEHLQSPVTGRLAECAQESTSVSIGDLLQADVETAKSFFEGLKDPKLLLAFPPEHDGGGPNATGAGLKTIEGIQNPAVFGPKPFKIREAVRRATERVRELYPDCPELPDSDAKEAPTFLEISSTTRINRRLT
jgi:hypothetical protein